jgi:hypothetical protein
MSEKVVARGPWYGWRVPSFAGSGCGGLFVLVSILALGRLPWAVAGSEKLFANAPLLTASVVVFALAVSYSLAKSVFLARAGRVELDDEGIVFRRGLFLKTRVAWSALEGFSDASSGRVDLVKKGERFARPSLAIPTRDDASRAAVLAALDAHGLRRLEASSRGRRLVRAAVAGVVAVLVFDGAVYLANARYRRLHAMWPRRFSFEEDCAFVDGCTSVRHLVRPVIGSEDLLYVESRPALHTAAFFVLEEQVSLDLVTHVEVDGAPVASSPDRVGFGYRIGGWWFLYGAPSFSAQSQFGPLTPGHHVLRLVSNVYVKSGTAAKVTTTSIDVVPGSIAARTVKLVRGPVPPVSVEARWSSGRWYPMVGYEDRSHALAMRVDFLEGGTELGRGALVAPAPAWGNQFLRGPGGKFFQEPKLTKGHHVLVARFTPDPKLAFENDVEITEILGFETFEREVVVDAP